MTHHEAQHEPGEEYDGDAELRAGDLRVTVHASLRGRFDPIDGRFHWYGRLAASRDLEQIDSGSTVTLTTGHGSAECRLSDVDPWGRPRVAGVGSPPF